MGNSITSSDIKALLSAALEVWPTNDTEVRAQADNLLERLIKNEPVMQGPSVNAVLSRAIEVLHSGATDEFTRRWSSAMEYRVEELLAQSRMAPPGTTLWGDKPPVLALLPTPGSTPPNRPNETRAAPRQKIPLFQREFPWRLYASRLSLLGDELRPKRPELTLWPGMAEAIKRTPIPLSTQISLGAQLVLNGSWPLPSLRQNAAFLARAKAQREIVAATVGDAWRALKASNPRTRINYAAFIDQMRELEATLLLTLSPVETALYGHWMESLFQRSFDKKTSVEPFKNIPNQIRQRLKHIPESESDPDINQVIALRPGTSLAKVWPIWERDLDEALEAYARETREAAEIPPPIDSTGEKRTIITTLHQLQGLEGGETFDPLVAEFRAHHPETMEAQAREEYASLGESIIHLLHRLNLEASYLKTVEPRVRNNYRNLFYPVEHSSARNDPYTKFKALKQVREKMEGIRSFLQTNITVLERAGPLEDRIFARIRILEALTDLTFYDSLVSKANTSLSGVSWQVMNVHLPDQAPEKGPFYFIIENASTTASDALIKEAHNQKVSLVRISATLIERRAGLTDRDLFEREPHVVLRLARWQIAEKYGRHPKEIRIREFVPEPVLNVSSLQAYRALRDMASLSDTGEAVPFLMEAIPSPEDELSLPQSDFSETELGYDEGDVQAFHEEARAERDGTESMAPASPLTKGVFRHLRI